MHLSWAADVHAEVRHLAKVPRVVLVEHDAVVVLATRITAPSRVLPVLADTPMPGRDVTALFAVLAQTCMHTGKRCLVVN